MEHIFIVGDFKMATQIAHDASNVTQEISNDPFFFSRERFLELYDNFEAPVSIKDCAIFIDKGLWPEVKMESFVREHNANRPDNDFNNRGGYNNRGGNPHGRGGRRNEWNNREQGVVEPGWDDSNNVDSGYFDADGRYIAGKAATVSKPAPAILKESDFTPDDWQKMRAAKIWSYIDINGTKQGPFSTARMHTWFNQNLLPMELPIGLDRSKEGLDTVYEELNSYFSGGLPFEFFSQDAILVMAKRTEVTLPEAYVKQQEQVAAALLNPVAPPAQHPAPKQASATPAQQKTVAPATAPPVAQAPTPAKLAPWSNANNQQNQNNNQSANIQQQQKNETKPVAQSNKQHQNTNKQESQAQSTKKGAPAWGTPLAPSAEAFEGPKNPGTAAATPGAAGSAKKDDSGLKFDMNVVKAWQSAQKLKLDLDVIDFLCTLKSKEEFIMTVTASLPTVTQEAAEELRRVLFNLPLPKGAAKPSNAVHIIPAVLATSSKQSSDWQNVKGGKSTHINANAGQHNAGVTQQQKK